MRLRDKERLVYEQTINGRQIPRREGPRHGVAIADTL